MIDQVRIKQFMFESIRETFDTMIFLPLEIADSMPGNYDAADSMICTITFAGQMRGAFSIQSRVRSAEKIARAMLMMQPEETIDEEGISDALGEVTNMVIGGIKTRLSETVPDMQISIPTVIKGQQIQPTIGKTALRADVTAQTADDFLKLVMMYREVA